jgi:hypothetical protein
VVVVAGCGQVHDLPQRLIWCTVMVFVVQAGVRKRWLEEWCQKMLRSVRHVLAGMFKGQGSALGGHFW